MPGPVRPQLPGAPVAAIDRLLAAGVRREFDAGEVVFHEGDPAWSCHVVQRGRFGVFVLADAGEPVTLTVMGPGETFGELGLLPGTPAKRSASVRALEPAASVEVNRADFEDLRSRHPEVNDVLFVMLAVRLRRRSDLLVEALHVPADRRVLRRLAELTRVYAGSDPVTIPLRQDQVASMAGTTRETVNRVLRTLVDAGTVRLGRGRIEVLDTEDLAHRAAV